MKNNQFINIDLSHSQIDNFCTFFYNEENGTQAIKFNHRNEDETYMVGTELWDYLTESGLHFGTWYDYRQTSECSTGKTYLIAKDA